MSNEYHDPQRHFSSVRESVEAFVAQHGLATAWRAWQEAHPLQPPEPPGAGIDFAADMRGQAKGDRRITERRRGERRQGGEEADAPHATRDAAR